MYGWSNSSLSGSSQLGCSLISPSSCGRHRRRFAVAILARNGIAGLDRLARPASRRIRISSSSMQAGTCRRAAASGRDGISAGAHPRRALPRHRRGLRPLESGAAHASRARPTSARRWSGSASAATTASSSTTIRPSARRRAAGSCFGTSARAQVAILDGGFQKWLAEGRPTESGEARSARRAIRSRGARRRGRHQAADPRRARLRARSTRAARAGSKATEPEPRPGVAGGHIPGARNLPFGQLYGEDGTVQIARGASRGCSTKPASIPSKPFIASCGSGRHRRRA